MILKLQKGKIIKQLVKYTAPKATELSSAAKESIGMTSGSNLEKVFNFVENDAVPRLKRAGHNIGTLTYPTWRLFDPTSMVDKYVGDSGAGAWFYPVNNTVTLRQNPSKNDFGLLVHEYLGHGIRYNLNPEYKPISTEQIDQFLKACERYGYDPHKVKYPGLNTANQLYTSKEEDILRTTYNKWFKGGLGEGTLNEYGAVNSQFRAKISERNNHIIGDKLDEAIDKFDDSKLLIILRDQPYTSSGTHKIISQYTGLTDDDITFLNESDMKRIVNENPILHDELNALRSTMKYVGGFAGMIGLGTSLSQIPSNKNGGIVKAQNGIGQILTNAPRKSDVSFSTEDIRRMSQGVINSQIKDNGERYAIKADKSNNYEDDPYVSEFFEHDVIPRYLREHPNATKAEIEQLRTAYHYPQSSGKLNPSYGGVTRYTNGDPEIIYNENRIPSRSTVVHENTHAYRHELGEVNHQNHGYDKKEQSYLNNAYDLDDYPGKINSISERGAMNSEIRYIYWKKLRDQLGRVPTLEEVDAYINNLPLGTLERVEHGVNAYGQHSINEQRDNRSNMFPTSGIENVSETERNKRDALIHVADNSEPIDITSLGRNGMKIKSWFNK